MKWYLKLFTRLLNIAMHNAMVIYQCLPDNKNMNLLKFRFSLAHTEKHGSGVPCPAYGRPSVEPLPKRLTERHFPKRIPATGKKARPQRKCVVCTKHGKRKESIYWRMNLWLEQALIGSGGTHIGIINLDYFVRGDFMTHGLHLNSQGKRKLTHLIVERMGEGHESGVSSTTLSKKYPTLFYLAVMTKG
jgi:hypothetical protein